MEIQPILKKHQLQFSFTLLLILLEAILAILFPLFIGYAIDSAISGSHQGVIHLGLLGLAALIVGVGRRIFDSRFYAKVYQSIGLNTISNIEGNVASTKSARLGMVRELVEFLENSLPELISNVIGLIGVIGIIATLNVNVFYGSLLIIFIVFISLGVFWNVAISKRFSTMNDS